jgi:hypothetical protein
MSRDVGVVAERSRPTFGLADYGRDGQPSADARRVSAKRVADPASSRIVGSDQSEQQLVQDVELHVMGDIITSSGTTTTSSSKVSASSSFSSSRSVLVSMGSPPSNHSAHQSLQCEGHEGHDTTQ